MKNVQKFNAAVKAAELKKRDSISDAAASNPPLKKIKKEAIIDEDMSLMTMYTDFLLSKIDCLQKLTAAAIEEDNKRSR